MESSSLHLTIRMSSMFLICFHSIFVFSVGCLNFKKSRNGDTLGPVELNVRLEQRNQGDRCEQNDQGDFV